MNAVRTVGSNEIAASVRHAAHSALEIESLSAGRVQRAPRVVVNKTALIMQHAKLLVRVDRETARV